MSLGGALRVLAAAALVFPFSLACGPTEEPLPVLGSVPAFELRDQADRVVRDGDLRGSPWVADFIFTRCPSACPMLTAQMGNLQRRLGAAASKVAMVSFSVDPENDTPAVLAEYAAAHGARGRWLFLTGDAAHVRETIVQGFRVHVGERTPIGTTGAYDIMHVQHFVLVDAQNRIRGYYPSDAEGLERLERDVRRLLDGE